MKEETRRERLKSEPYLRLKKRKTLFWKKIEIFEKKISFKRSRIVPKNVKGGYGFINPSGFIKKYSVAKCQKTQRGDPLGTVKSFRKKVAQFRKKSKGDFWALPFGHVRFCMFP